MRALRFHELGGPEVLRCEDAPAPALGPGKVLVDVRAAGLNFADTRFIRGKYFVQPRLPDVPGMEAAGVVRAVAPDVTGLAPGDRVIALGRAAFAEQMVASVTSSYPIPAALDFERAAALGIQGLSAHHLLFLIGGLQRGERVWIQAAAGGVGTLAVQLAKRAGATVVASASRDKHALLRRLGADAVIDSHEDVLHQLKDAVGEVDLVLEMIGGTEQYKKDLAVLRSRGRVLVYGAASGDTRGTFEPIGLMGKNLSFAGYHLTPLLAERALCAPPLAELCGLAVEGALEVVIGARAPLSEGAKAFADLERRATSGKVVLLP
ncbi:MAG: NADPH:quinone oxidoreductase family protein [Polyangiaceae bacterium]|jgi:NADPH2:quinone reductase|nr:NADPH:quinone oxidoreductase family protein [Polyangiaceae bacterium]MBK8939329.1 NADPH:quinone oxidoreductase family protein [Polyangiaceae bacterium]